jgi:hypothetical protein
VPPPPVIPEEEPPTAQLRNRVIKEIAKWALRAALRIPAGPVGTALLVLEAAWWVYQNYPNIKSYLDAPKSLDELKDAVSNPEKGYDIHHIVEQTPAENDGFSRDLIDSRDNLVRIPTLKHWEITGWYARPNGDFGGLSPRAYLRGKDWQERVRIGHKALRIQGVLAP